MAVTTTTTTTTALEQLTLLQSSASLSLLDLATSFTKDTAQEPSGARTSDASSTYSDPDVPTPASLAADLAHYKELFDKLSFSYIEQVTKEKFLRAITAETPLFIEPADNAALESQLALEEEELKEQKAQVAALTQQLEARGRELATRYEGLVEQGQMVQDLPGHLAELEAQIAELRGEYPSPVKSGDEQLNLPLADTLVLLAEQQKELAETEAQIAALQSEGPERARELARVEEELAGLTTQKKMAVGRAREARARKEAGGIDEVERRGRWLRAEEALLSDFV
ncbi:hypothetical protein BT63DRAFT_420129 [Microthyrium microscopicum]|uniref:Kinetochore protein Sos7 coiled-coil domain-containing protein n=1 Tax=Microthyrium microscopicum TaxID=703497 RepID=A0A6A6URK5_9PEZI|nr:hypothetical protein BT63DRAFT_420129 [Microthyrium microscopicum]